MHSLSGTHPSSIRGLLCTALTALVVAITCAPHAESAIVIPVSGANIDNNSGGGNIFAPAFDAQPILPPTDGQAGTAVNDGFNYFGTDRYAGVDFGTDYFNLSITSIFVQQGTYGSASATLNYYWSADTTLDLPASPTPDATAPNFNLLTYNGHNSGGGSDPGIWTQVYNNPTGVTPQARYLIVHYISGNEGNFKYEMAFVGDVVPEPALGIMALGALLGLGAIQRRR